MKKINYIFPISLLGLFLYFPQNAYASLPQIQTRTAPAIKITVTTTPTTTPTATPTASPSLIIKAKPSINIKQIVGYKKTNVLKEIERRLGWLNSLVEKIGKIQRLTATQKETLTAQIKTEITNLEQYYAKIEAETTATNLQEQKKSINNSYKIYALYVPKIEIISHADKIIEIADALANKTVDEKQLKIISDSKAKAESAIDLVLPLLPEEYPDYRTTLKSARDLLREARTNLNNVFSLIKADQQSKN